MDLVIPGVIGGVLAIGAFLLGRLAGFDRDRAYYPTILIVIASYYLLFAVLGGSTRALVLESVLFTACLAAAVLGFRGSLWLVVVGLVGHGIQDLFHDHLILNPGLPGWWPIFCSAFDVVAGGLLAWLLLRPSRPRVQGFEGGRP